MKISNTCPKCLGNQIAVIEGGTFKGNVYNTISLTFNVIYLTRYVCTQCGYCENYIDSPSDLETIKRKFLRNDFPDDYV
ncbi:MAG TPA: hypothetical protein PK611_00405 [Saprospiraceae bacterium]|jgi:predicted nucleic-acid-binding Zn-ribbon protein|nr:hypothetical protein [Saprospiraceae bacterium]HRO07687.1 hypothetical protein [Saprospiraceae bacterium]HRO72111.1 hypothetical protein [Saprospiraceae bacterium]HRP40969.1 hypothetical protein [Saprospiraceae bacterium]